MPTVPLSVLALFLVAIEFVYSAPTPLSGAEVGKTHSLDRDRQWSLTGGMAAGGSVQRNGSMSSVSSTGSSAASRTINELDQPLIRRKATSRARKVGKNQRAESPIRSSPYRSPSGSSSPLLNMNLMPGTGRFCVPRSHSTAENRHSGATMSAPDETPLQKSKTFPHAIDNEEGDQRELLVPKKGLLRRGLRKLLRNITGGGSSSSKRMESIPEEDGKNNETSSKRSERKGQEKLHNQTTLKASKQQQQQLEDEEQQRQHAQQQQQQHVQQQLGQQPTQPRQQQQQQQQQQLHLKHEQQRQQYGRQQQQQHKQQPQQQQQPERQQLMQQFQELQRKKQQQQQLPQQSGTKSGANAVDIGNRSSTNVSNTRVPYISPSLAATFGRHTAEGQSNHFPLSASKLGAAEEEFGEISLRDLFGSVSAVAHRKSVDSDTGSDKSLFSFRKSSASSRESTPPDTPSTKGWWKIGEAPKVQKAQPEIVPVD